MAWGIDAANWSAAVLSRSGPDFNARFQKSPYAAAMVAAAAEDGRAPSLRFPALCHNYPVHRLLRQFVKRRHTHFQMLLLRVLDFVVADAVEALDKHHDDRHA